MQGSARKDVVFGAAGVYPCDRARAKMEILVKVRNVLAQRFEVLKILPKGLSDDQQRVDRFLRETKIRARLSHPNIVSFYPAFSI